MFGSVIGNSLIHKYLLKMPPRFEEAFFAIG